MAEKQGKKKKIPQIPKSVNPNSYPFVVTFEHFLYLFGHFLFTFVHFHSPCML